MLVTAPYRRSRRILHVPPIPPTIGLIDRATGKVWYLKVDTSALDPRGQVRFCLVDTISNPDQLGAHISDAWSGPFLSGSYRLLVRNGRLGYEAAPGYNVNSQSIIARDIRNNLIWYLLALPTSVKFPPADQLAYTLEPSRPTQTQV